MRPVSELPDDVAALIGEPQYPQTATFDVERSYGFNTVAATQNANPIYWDDAVAAELTAGPTLPLTTLSLWMRPHFWEPGAQGEQLALQAHFDLKERFGLPEAVMTDNTLVFHRPVRPGDRISHRQVLRSVSGEKTTKLGTGRFWVIDIDYRAQSGEPVGVESYTGFGYRRAGPAPPGAAPNEPGSAATTPGEPGGETLRPLPVDVTATTVVLGALASRDWRPMHHDYKFATERNGVADIFLNTPNQAAWFERYVTDWTGPRGRLGRMTVRMRTSVFPGDRMTLTGNVATTSSDSVGCRWADLDLRLSVGNRVASTCTARVAIPATPDDNPWSRTGDQWCPDPEPSHA